MDPFVLLIVGALGLAGCLLLLYFGIQMMRDERAAKEGKAAAERQGAMAETTPAEDVTPAQASAGASPAANVLGRPSPLSGVAARLGSGRSKGNAHEVLRVLRDNLTGRLVIELAGQRFASLRDLQDPTLYQGLVTTLRDLQAFAGEASTPGEPPPEPASAPPLGLGTAPTMAHDSPAPAAAPPGATPPAARLAGTSAEGRPRPAPSMNPFKQLQVLRELAKNPPPPPKSIAEQIDEVLQGKLAGTPLLQRGIRMRPGPRGEAIFDLDGHSYPAVDEVPDADVRAVIRAAIAEWERAGA
jgi:hypothetical protein